MAIAGCNALATPPSGELATGEKQKAAAYPSPDTTFLTFDQGHGYQVSYIGEDNRIWLWYPGNSRSLPGTYEVKKPRICFSYEGPTYNPISGDRSGTSCTLLHWVRRRVLSSAQGDIFNLSSGEVPYKRPRCDDAGKFVYSKLRAWSWNSLLYRNDESPRAAQRRANRELQAIFNSGRQFVRPR